MRWCELDFEKGTWTILGSRSKNGQVHDVQLAEPVLDILGALRRYAASDLVFTTTGTTPISVFVKVTGRIDITMGTSTWRTHDLRRTAASGIARLGISSRTLDRAKAFLVFEQQRQRTAGFGLCPLRGRHNPKHPGDIPGMIAKSANAGVVIWRS
jgi:integrase